MKKESRLELWVGLFVLLGLCAALFLSLQAANLGTFGIGEKTYEVTATFDNVGGLKPRAPVKSAGVTVGRVQSIHFDPTTFKAVVTLRLLSDYPFPEDSSVTILTSGLLGEQYVGLTPGGEDANLQNGGQIRRTQGAIVLENLISRFLFNQAEKGK